MIWKPIGVYLGLKVFSWPLDSIHGDKRHRVPKGKKINKIKPHIKELTGLGA